MIIEYIKGCLKEVSIDCVIFGFDKGELKVLLLKWKNIDFWSLPGGKIPNEVALDTSAITILEARAGLKDVFLQQFHVFGDLNRCKYYDEKETRKLLEKSVQEDFSSIKFNQRILSVGYYALVDLNKVKTEPDLFTDKCHWWNVDEIPKLLFDHNEMIEKALKTLKKEIRFQPIGNLLPDKFTLAELQKLYESILQRKLDRRNFHKLLTSQDFLIKLDEKRKGAANKAPYLYKVDRKKYEEALQSGTSF